MAELHFSIRFFASLLLRLSSLNAHPFQISVDKGIQRPVQHGVGVAALHLRAKVFYQLVGLEHIGSDLVAPGDILDLTPDIRQLLDIGLLL